MSGYRILLYATLAGAVIASLLNDVFVMPMFMAFALPGILLSFGLTKTISADGHIIVFMGNWIFYTVVLSLLLLIVRKVRARKHDES